MPDKFVPLMATPVPTGETPHPKVLPKAEARPLFEPLPASNRAEPPPAKDCGQPSVTLQRQGEVVSGIRIECGCGQVIELACAY